MHFINKIVEQFSKKPNPIFCYGAGKYGRLVKTFLEEQGINIDGFVTTIEYECKKVLCTPVYTFDNLPFAMDSCKFILSADAKNQKEMMQVLSKYNISDFYIISKEDIEYIKSHIQYTGVVDDYIKVLVYHRVIDLNTDPYDLAVSPAIFEQQIQFFKKNYPVLRFEDDWSNVKKKSLVITFDDGYFDFYKYALPILKKYQVPATIFVSTGNIDTNKEFWCDEIERLLFLNPNLPPQVLLDGKEIGLKGYNTGKVNPYTNEVYRLLRHMHPVERERTIDTLKKQLLKVSLPRESYRTLNTKELIALGKSSLITVGSHTVSHTQLSVECADLQRAELYYSKNKLESILERKIEAFSYPFGGKENYTMETMRIVKECGYKKAAATYLGNDGNSKKLLEIPRVTILNHAGEMFSESIRQSWYII